MKIGPLSFGDALPATEEGLPEWNCFFVAAGRHDRDRVEVQVGFDGLVQSAHGKFDYDVDLVLFVPKTLGLLEVDDQGQLRQEFQSYVRLHTHVSDPKSETSLSRVKDRLTQLKESLHMDSIRIFAIEFEGFLKAQTKRIKKHFTGEEVTELHARLARNDIDAIRALVEDFRSVLGARHIEGRRIDHAPRGSLEHDLLLLNEYLSHLYVHSLAQVSKLARTKLTANDEVLAYLESLGRAEAELRIAAGLLVAQRQGPHDSFDEDLYLHRVSQLKKYFQKSLFIQVRGESLQKRMLVPVYAISAALAASWAIMVQLYQARTTAQRLGINSIAVIAVAIIAYVAKDVMKDFFRRYFLNRSHRFFADFEKKLYLSKNGEDVYLGEIQEFVKRLNSEELPPTLRKARFAAVGGEIDEYLQEDVLHFKKRVSLDLSALDSKKEFPWGMREVIRYRFDRLRTSMEDAFKNMNVVSPAGHYSVRLGHRLYIIHMAIWIRKLDSPEVKPQFKSYRITLDKSGVLGCESVKWDKAPGAGIPDIPGDR